MIIDYSSYSRILNDYSNLRVWIIIIDATCADRLVWFIQHNDRWLAT